MARLPRKPLSTIEEAGVALVDMLGLDAAMNEQWQITESGLYHRILERDRRVIWNALIL